MGFTVMSFMVRHRDLDHQMIIYRALQGFLGGGMIPTVFAAAYSVFRARSRAWMAPLIAWWRRWRRPSARPLAAISPNCSPGTGCFSSTSSPHLRRHHHGDAGGFRRARPRSARPLRLVGLLFMAGFSAAWNSCWRRGRPMTGSRMSGSSSRRARRRVGGGVLSPASSWPASRW